MYLERFLHKMTQKEDQTIAKEIHIFPRLILALSVRAEFESRLNFAVLKILLIKS